jgi:hypothetical protein
MRLIANLLLTVSLAVGALAAATAYNVSLALPDAEVDGLTLNADAGPGPIARKGQTLTPGLLKELREYQVLHVRVREFHFWLWPGKWVFLTGLLGLLGAAALIRTASRQEIASAAAAKEVEGPEKALQGVKEIVDGLRRELLGAPAGRTDLWDRLGQEDRGRLETFMRAREVLSSHLSPEEVTALHQAHAFPVEEDRLQAIRERLGPDKTEHLDTFLQTASALAESLGPLDFAQLPGLALLPRELQERLRLILTRLTEAQRTHMPAFVEARPVLIARLGLAGFAELMSTYAAAERQINRAWSAAADGVYEEALRCLELASQLLDAALQILP